MINRQILKRRLRGFTLVELLTTVAIVGIASAIALPSYRSMTQDSAVSTQASELLISLNLARSEAVKRNARVTMCRSTDGLACSSEEGNWSSGWIVFVDGNTAGAVDADSSGKKDEILRVHGRVKGLTLVGDGNVGDYVSYDSSGRTATTDAAAAQQLGNLSVCSAVSTLKRRRIALTAGTGWVGVQALPGSGTCTA